MNHLRLREKEIFVGEAKFRRDASKGKKVLDSDGVRREADTRVVDRGKIHGKDGDPPAERVVDCESNFALNMDHFEVRKRLEHVSDPQ
ncbi:hypothetical protein S83_031813 [Arachis hypogaea]